MIVRQSAASVLVASFLAMSGCGPRSGGSAPARPAPSTSPAGAQATGGIGAPRIAWTRKTHAQRLDYMGLYVLPRMEMMFKDWRPDDYADMRCQTCHGENFDKPPINFEMPRISFPLKKDDPIGSAMKYDAEAARFMTEKVVPAMAELLGEKPFDPRTGQGFSCFRCHPARAKPPR